jgi:organic radical activating enzyme
MSQDPAETLWHVTVLSNFARGYDKYARTYSKAGIPESSYPNRFFLLQEGELGIGIRKAGGLLEKLGMPGNRLLVLRTNVPADALKANTRTGFGRFVESASIRVDGVAFIDGDAPGGRLAPISVEEASARSFALLSPSIQNYWQLRPRTFSILPIARGCQASCPFCFSEASASAEQEQDRLNLEVVRRFAIAARAQGAERFVITGGGEPGLVRHELLRDAIAAGNDVLGKSVLITNGHHLARRDPAATLTDYARAGLSVLAISRHHHDDDTSERLMSLRTDVARVARAWNDGRSAWPNLRLRFTCVLQRGGVDCMDGAKRSAFRLITSSCPRRLPSLPNGSRTAAAFA